MTFEAADEELSTEKIAIVLPEVFARGKDVHIAYTEVQEGRQVFGKEVKELKENDRVKRADQQGEIDVFTRKEDKEKAYVFARKESKQPVKDAEKDYVGKDVKGEAYVFARKESKEIIADNFKGGERPQSSDKDEKEIAVFTCKEDKKERDRIEKVDQRKFENAGRVVQEEGCVGVTSHKNMEKFIKKINAEAVKGEQLVVKGDVEQVKKPFKKMERSFHKVTVGVDESSNWDIEGRKIVKTEVVCEVFKEESNGEEIGMAEDCSTVGVQVNNNVYGRDGEAVKSDVVLKTPKEEILEVKDIAEKMGKAAAVKETLERFKTAETVNVKVQKGKSCFTELFGRIPSQEVVVQMYWELADNVLQENELSDSSEDSDLDEGDIEPNIGPGTNLQVELVLEALIDNVRETFANEVLFDDEDLVNHSEWVEYCSNLVEDINTVENYVTPRLQQMSRPLMDRATRLIANLGNLAEAIGRSCQPDFDVLDAENRRVFLLGVEKKANEL